MSTIVELDQAELLLWTILRKFESLALTQYELYEFPLATAEKHALVDLLFSQASADDALWSTTLYSPVKTLLADAAGSGEFHTLIGQALMLEVLGQTIYQAFSDNELVSPATHALCVMGLKASKANRGKLAALFAEKFGHGTDLVPTFIASSKSVVADLDKLGVGIDEHFSKRFGLQYADLMGDFVAELIPVCVELGIDRRTTIGCLTDALMRS